MVQAVKVHIINLDRMESKEVSLEEARKLMADAYAHGLTVIDKRTGYVINEDEVPSAIDEIIIAGIIEGG